MTSIRPEAFACFTGEHVGQPVNAPHTIRTGKLMGAHRKETTFADITKAAEGNDTHNHIRAEMAIPASAVSVELEAAIMEVAGGFTATEHRGIWHDKETDTTHTERGTTYRVDVPDIRTFMELRRRVAVVLVSSGEKWLDFNYVWSGTRNVNLSKLR